MKTIIYCFISIAFLLADCKQSTEPTTTQGSMILPSYWNGHIDNIPLLIGYSVNNDSLVGRIAWSHNDSLIICNIDGKSKIVGDSIHLVGNLLILLHQPIYLNGKISGDTMSGTYQSSVTSLGLSSSGSWNATKAQ